MRFVAPFPTAAAPGERRRAGGDLRPATSNAIVITMTKASPIPRYTVFRSRANDARNVDPDDRVRRYILGEEATEHSAVGAHRRHLANPRAGDLRRRLLHEELEAPRPARPKSTLSGNALDGSSYVNASCRMPGLSGANKPTDVSRSGDRARREVTVRVELKSRRGARKDVRSTPALRLSRATSVTVLSFWRSYTSPIGRRPLACGSADDEMPSAEPDRDRPRRRVEHRDDAVVARHDGLRAAAG